MYVFYSYLCIAAPLPVARQPIVQHSLHSKLRCLLRTMKYAGNSRITAESVVNLREVDAI